MIQPYCNYCGCDNPKHAFWCRVGGALADEKRSLSRSAPGQSAEDFPAGLVPAKELISHAYPSLPPENPAAESRGLKVPQPEVEGETHQRREFVVIQRDRKKPEHATLKLVQVFVQPNGRLLVCNVRELIKGSILISTQEPTDPLSGKPRSIVVGLEFDALKALNEGYPRVGSFTLIGLDDAGWMLNPVS